MTAVLAAMHRPVATSAPRGLYRSPSAPVMSATIAAGVTAAEKPAVSKAPPTGRPAGDADDDEDGGPEWPTDHA